MLTRRPRTKTSKIQRMRPRHHAETFDWLDCPAPRPAIELRTKDDSMEEEKAMFRIHSNIPATPTLTQALSGTRLDGRPSTHLAARGPSTSAQMRIVGRPDSAERHRAEIGPMRQMNQDIAAAATVAQVVESGLQTVMGLLTDLYQLATRAGDENLTTGERVELMREARRLQEELERVSSSARINGIPLLNGAQRALTFQIGNGLESAEVHLSLMDTRPDSLLPGVTADVLASPISANAVAEMVSEVIAAIHERLEKVQAFQERLEAALERLESAPRVREERVPTPTTSEEAQQLLEQARSQLLSIPTHAVAVQAAMLSPSAIALITP